MDVHLAWIVLALLALVATLSVTEVVRVTAVRLRAVDQPGGRRVHRTPTARLGGLGIFWGFAAALAAATYANQLVPLALDPSSAGLLGVLLGAGIVLVTGVLDDVYGLPATLKLALQLVAALCVWAFGWRVDTIGLPGLRDWSVGLWSLPLTVGWLVLVTNAVNLIDGLDGLAGGVALTTTLACAWLLAGTHAPSFLVSAALAGALAGFLWFNLHPALIFMGDTGSLFVGFMLAALTLRTSQLTITGGFPVLPALLLAVPLLDTLDAIRRRTLATLREGHAPLAIPRALQSRLFTPDGLHVHHRMLRRGLSARRAAATLWGAAACFAASACVLAAWPVVGLGTAAAIGAVAMPRLLGGPVRIGPLHTPDTAAATPLVTVPPPAPVEVIGVELETVELGRAA